MVPGKDDPIWEMFVENIDSYEFSSLPTRMMHTRIKQMLQGGEKQEAIDVAVGFFTDNEAAVAADLAIITG